MAVVRGRCAVAGFVGFVGQVASCIFYAQEVDVQWGLLGSSWESIRKHGRDFPTLRRSVWVVWRAFGAVSWQFWCRLAGRPALVKPARPRLLQLAAGLAPGARNPHGPARCRRTAAT